VVHVGRISIIDEKATEREREGDVRIEREEHRGRSTYLEREGHKINLRWR
jgi:hypothetical protein